ncbi:MAG TPA: Fic family protein [Acidobacteriaceae bacterium]
MPDWDRDSPKLDSNLDGLIAEVARAVRLRETASVEQARRWHRAMMAGLKVPDPVYVGAFRGETDLENVQVRIVGRHGLPADQVSEELKRFERKLQDLVAALDSLVGVGDEPNADQLSAIIDLAAWAHTEWIRIHPFANGNGRTARLWANSIVMRYGLPPFIGLRPRPNTGYAASGASAMRGNWEPTAAVFRRLLDIFLNEQP